MFSPDCSFLPHLMFSRLLLLLFPVVDFVLDYKRTKLFLYFLLKQVTAVKHLTQILSGLYRQLALIHILSILYRKFNRPSACNYQTVAHIKHQRVWTASCYDPLQDVCYFRRKNKRCNRPESLLQVSDYSFHLAVCLTTGPKPLPKPALHTVRSRASSFKWEYPLLSLRSSPPLSFLR